MAIQERELQSTDPLEGLQLIDSDSHLTEPPDLWISRAPKSMKDQMPVQKTVDGMTAWFLGGEPWASTGGNTIQVDGNKLPGENVQPFDSVHPASWETKERLKLLDEIGIWAQVLYPNGVGFAANHIFGIEDDSKRKTILQIYNDFLVDVQCESNFRLFPQALLPIWDMDFTVAEMNRLLPLGITGFTLTDKPELLGLPELPDSYFDPMWDAFDGSGGVVNFHVASGLRNVDMDAIRESFTKRATDDQPASAMVGGSVAPAWRSFGRQRRMSVTLAQGQMTNMRIIANLCMSNLFDRYPRLKIVSVESGIGWIPFFLEILEYQFDEFIHDEGERAFARERPSQYFRDHIYATYWFERIAPQKLVDDIGRNNIMVETDVPHPTCFYPNPRERLGDVLKDVDFDIRRRLIQDNAAELYGIPLEPKS